jgi:hypothetical protein
MKLRLMIAVLALSSFAFAQHGGGGGHAGGAGGAGGAATGSPRLPHIPPQLDHKNTTPKHPLFLKPPQKHQQNDKTPDRSGATNFSQKNSKF